MFKLVVEQPRSEGIFESGLEIGDLGIEFESVPDLGGFETGAEPVTEVGQGETEPSPVFEDFLRSSFNNLDRVADVESDEEPQTPIEIIQTKPVQLPPIWRGPPNKAFQNTCGKNRSPARSKFVRHASKIDYLSFTTKILFPKIHCQTL